MTPVNNKSLIHFLFSQMEKLDSNQIDVATASAQANLAKQVNNSLKYELDRAKTQIEIEKHNKEINSKLVLREVETKLFENV
jgi:uncharacterized protein YfeS